MPDDPGSDDAGPDDAGPDDAGPDDPGPDDAGPDDPGSNDPGSDAAGAAFAAALEHHQAGRTAAARAGYLEVLSREPDHADSLHLLGLLLVQDAEPAAGAALIQRAMRLAPGRAPHHNSLGLAWRRLGRDADAAREFRAAAALRPDSAEIHNNLATVLRDLGQFQDAVAGYRRALACASDVSPGVAEIWYNLASTLAEHGPPEEAEACFRRVIGSRPDHADAIANYGRFLLGQTRWAEAEAWLIEATHLAPDTPLTWNNLAIARQQLGRLAAAESSYHRSLAIDPGFADAHFNLGCLLAGDGRPDEARMSHAAAVAADPLHGAARLAECMAWLPVIYRAEPEIAARRAGYLAALDRLAAAVEAPEVARAVAAAIGTSQPFFLPYQGENDRAPQSLFGAMTCRLAAELDGLPALPRVSPGAGRIRVGLVSGFFQDHTVFRLFLEGWLSELDRDRFEVTAFHTGLATDAETARAERMSERFVRGPASVAAWRDAIRAAAPDVLLYPEVGMDPVAGALAARRLAPVQCVAWGQPETTGMPTLDHFLTADLMEPEDADAHYTERLIRLPGIGVHYTPDRAPEPLPRAALGLHPGAPVYWSGQALYKYLPQYDQVFPRIAAAVGRCRFVFIAFAKSEAVTAAFRARLGCAFAAFGLDAEAYCVILPSMPRERFLAAVGAADVVLDTPGWSGGKSTLDCLVQGAPIVTLPGRFMRGRHTAAILRHIGCETTIAASLDDYIAVAVRLGLDTAARAAARRAVEAGRHRAFRDTAPIRALETFLRQAVGHQ